MATSARSARGCPAAITRDDAFIETKVWISDYGYDATLHAFEMSTRKLGVEALSPLGKGYLIGKIDEKTTFDPSDFRNTVPRFAPENRKANQALLDLVATLAARKGATVAQLTPDVAAGAAPPVDRADPRGTTGLHRLEEDLGAIVVALTAADLREIDAAASRITVQGYRYSDGSQRMIDR